MSCFMPNVKIRGTAQIAGLLEVPNSKGDFLQTHTHTDTQLER